MSNRLPFLSSSEYRPEPAGWISRMHGYRAFYAHHRMRECGNALVLTPPTSLAPSQVAVRRLDGPVLISILEKIRLCIGDILTDDGQCGDEGVARPDKRKDQ